MLNLTLEAADRFVSGHPDAFWDGWTVVVFRETPAGYASKNGMFRNGKWGVASRVEPDILGRYRFRA